MGAKISWFELEKTALEILIQITFRRVGARDFLSFIDYQSLIKVNISRLKMADTIQLNSRTSY